MNDLSLQCEIAREVENGCKVNVLYINEQDYQRRAVVVDDSSKFKGI